MGMATVVPAESFEEVSRMNAEKLFGVPAMSFDDATAAIAWVRDSIRQRLEGLMLVRKNRCDVGAGVHFAAE